MRGFGGIGGSGGGGAFGRLSHGRNVAYRGAEGSPTGYGGHKSAFGGDSSAYGRLGIARDAATAARPWDPTRGSFGFNAGRYARGWAGIGATEPTSAEQAGEFVGSYTAAADARVKSAALEAQIANLEATMAKLPSFLQWPLQSSINVKRAKLAAYQEKLGIQVQGEDSWAVSRVITQTGGVVAIIAGVALTGLLVTLAVKHGRAAKVNGRRRNGRRRSRR